MNNDSTPNLVVLAGPNGAGKSTAALVLLRGALHVDEFVNADTIARGLSAFNPESAALEAGRTMLKRLDELAAARANFAFETTLASRSFAPKLERWIAIGYRFHLIFLWLPNADLAVERVASRVRDGGHSVSEEIIRRRYRAGLRNFFELYKPLAFSWSLLDNSTKNAMSLVANGGQTIETAIALPAVWTSIESEYGHVT